MHGHKPSQYTCNTCGTVHDDPELIVDGDFCVVCLGDDDESLPEEDDTDLVDLPDPEDAIDLINKINDL